MDYTSSTTLAGNLTDVWIVQNNCNTGGDGKENLNHFRAVRSGQTAVCGNGIRETGEQCDGGAVCTSSCKF